MARIKGVRNLPSWKKSMEYNELSNLHNSELLNQLSIRKEFYYYIKDRINFKELCELGINADYQRTYKETGWDVIKLNFFEYCKAINERRFIIKPKPSSYFEILYPKEEQALIKESDRLASSEFISGINTSSAYDDLVFLREKSELEFGFGVKYESISCRADYADTSILIKKHGIDISCVDISINLKNSTNKEILEQIEPLLIEWREQLKIPENIDAIYPSEHEKRNITKYKVIQIMDLMIWELVSQNKIALPTFDRAVFDDDSDIDFEQVAYKLTKRMLNENYKL